MHHQYSDLLSAFAHKLLETEPLPLTQCLLWWAGQNNNNATIPPSKLQTDKNANEHTSNSFQWQIIVPKGL